MSGVAAYLNGDYVIGLITVVLAALILIPSFTPVIIEHLKVKDIIGRKKPKKESDAK